MMSDKPETFVKRKGWPKGKKRLKAVAEEVSRDDIIQDVIEVEVVDASTLPEPVQADNSRIPGINLTMSQVSTLLKEVVQAAREPDEETKEAKAKEKARKAINLAENMETARIEMMAVEHRQSSCGHVKENGRPSTGGQLHSDGMFHEFCLRCQKVIRVFRPSQEQVMSA